jgi:uncharacterized membrane protein YeaQ/YmgE (transglycosylase-associated protein family)
MRDNALYSSPCEFAKSAGKKARVGYLRPTDSKIRERENGMYLLAWILIGAVVGWGVGRRFQGNGYGPLMDILMGIGGAVVGGFTMSLVGVGGYGGTIITSLVAMLSAAVLTVVAAYVNGRRIFARQL